MRKPGISPSAAGWRSACCASAQFVVVLDASIVNVALPTIGKALDFSQENLSWVVNAYVLTFGGFLLLGGRIADLLGRRRVFMFGLVLFALASLAGGFANSEGMLIAARAVQGLGAAILSPAALSIVTTTFQDGAERNKALGVWGAVAGLGRRGRRAARRRPHRQRSAGSGCCGSTCRSASARRCSLRRCSPRAAPTPRRAPSTSPARSASPPGLSVLVYALVDATDAGWGSTQTIGLLGARGRAAGRVRRRSSCAPTPPLVPFRIFRIRTLTGANVVGLLIGASLFSMFFFISLYMQQVLGYSAIKAGLSYLPLALTIIIAAGSRLAARDQGRASSRCSPPAWCSSPPA